MEYKFTRAIYKRIKKYDKEDMEDFIQSVYLKDFNDAHKNTDINKAQAKEKLKEVKGFGEKPYQRL